jgi:hypothetical protein
VWERLAREPVEAVALAAGARRRRAAAEVAERYLRELRHVRPSLSGDDLQRAGCAAASGAGARRRPRVALDRPGAGPRGAARRRAGPRPRRRDPRPPRRREVAA